MRAVITVFGRPVLATMVGGQPHALGRKLKQCGFDLSKVVSVTRNHGLFFVDPVVFDKDTLRWASREEDRTKVCGHDYGAGIESWGQFQYEFRYDDLLYRPLVRDGDQANLIPLTQREIEEWRMKLWKSKIIKR